jgi:futalosine hydrolase
MGKTNAAHAATRLILDYAPSFIINFGIGGAYPSSGLNTGDLAVATKEVYADEGIQFNNRFETLETIGIPLLKAAGKRYFNEFPLDNKLCKTAVDAGLRTGVNVKAGVFATVSTCTGTKERSAEISSRFGAVCENMEGAAIAHICCLYKIPCIEIRGISNIVEDRDVSKWEIKLAAENCQKALIEFFSMPEIRDLKRLHPGQRTKNR